MISVPATHKISRKNVSFDVFVNVRVSREGEGLKDKHDEVNKYFPTDKCRLCCS